ncbi:MAG: ABC transporter ATP-binding protein [Bacteroidales bacterium]|jgi:iron complex transport system ATP-binding protein|nr:ABC transporter ATP-binding protein [Bacteroidales bacterium]
MIHIRDIEFSYHIHPVLQDVSCHIGIGDFVALVGPNGSGKSTLIKCISGILRVQKGEILIDGKTSDAYSANEMARKVAYVPQSERGRLSATVFDTVLMGRKPYISWKPSANDLDITAGILKLLDIGHLSMKRTDELSGGQQQIVMIARALAQEPEVLLLDEPTANLDIRHQLEVMEVLKTLSAKEMTIVIAIHDINMAVRYASHIMMLKDGHIFSYGGREVITTEHIETLYQIPVDIIDRDGQLFIVPGKWPGEK